MLEMFYFGQYEALAYVTPYDHYHTNGTRGAIFDVDSTLANRSVPADGQAVELFEHLHQIGMNTCLLSNNKEPRIKHSVDRMGSACIHKAGRPEQDGYERATERMSTGRKMTIFVGDQLFIDVYGTNRAGIHSTLVKPINPKEEIQIVLKRYLEGPVLYFYKRQCRRKAREKGLGSKTTKWTKRQECADPQPTRQNIPYHR